MYQVQCVLQTILDLRRMDRPCKKGKKKVESTSTIVKYVLWVSLTFFHTFPSICRISIFTICLLLSSRWYLHENFVLKKGSLKEVPKGRTPAVFGRIHV